MKVIATSRGFANGRIYEVGEQFDVDGKRKSSWYVPVEKQPAARKDKPSAVDKDGEKELA